MAETKVLIWTRKKENGSMIIACLLVVLWFKMKNGVVSCDKREVKLDEWLRFWYYLWITRG